MPLDQEQAPDQNQTQAFNPDAPYTVASQAQPPQPAQSQASSADLTRPQRFPQATGIADVNGQSFWHDIKGNQLGPLIPEESAQMGKPAQAAPPSSASSGFDPNKPYETVSSFNPDKPYTTTQKAPPQTKGLWNKFTDWVNKGLVSQSSISKVLTGMSTEELNAALKSDPNIQGKTVHIPGFGDIDLTEFTKGVFNSTAKVASDFTSPLSAALFAAGPLMGAGRSAQAIRAAKAAQVADDSVVAAESLYAARTGELIRATTQAGEAEKAAQAAREAELAGQAGREAVIAAENTASQSAANLARAQKAVQLAADARAGNLVQAAKANRAAHEAIEASRAAGAAGLLPESVGTAARAVGRTAAVGFTAQGAKSAITPKQEGETLADELERRIGGLGWSLLGAEGLKGTAADANLSELPGAVKQAPRTIGEAFKNWHDERAQANATEELSAAKEQAHKDLMKAMPPTNAAPYTYQDLEVGRNYLEQQHKVEKITNSEQLRDAFESQREGIERKVSDLVRQKFGDESLVTNPKLDVYNALAELESTKPGDRQAGMDAISKYNITDMSLSEADALRKRMNDDNRAILKKNSWAITDALSTDPEFAAKYYLAESLRNGIYDRLENKGVTGAREMRQDESSLIKLRNAADKQKFNGERTVRGTGEVGTFRKGAAKVSTLAGAATGAAVGAATSIPLAPEAGAVIGAGLGRKVGEYIAPPDLTRNELIQRSLDSTIGTPPRELKGKGEQPTPKTEAPVEKQQVQVQNTRENSPLHSQLATHYDETIGETPYLELEKRFLDDVKINKQHKVPLDSSEKAILKGINEAKAKEILDARREIEKQSKEAAKNPERRAELSAEELPKLGVSALRAVAERVPDFLDNFTVEKAPIEKGYVGTINYKGKPFAYLGVPSEAFEKVFGQVSDYLGKEQTKQAEDTFDHLLRRPRAEVAAEELTKPGVVGSHVAFADAPRLEIPKERLPYGHTEDSFHNHEWGHAAVAAAEGFDATNIASHEHPAVRDRLKSVGGVGFKELPYIEDPQALEKYTPKQIWENTKKWLTVDMGGAAANELLDNMKFADNRGLATDKKNARAMLEGHGLTGKEADVMMQLALERAKNHLTKPGVLDSIRENAKVREENLPKELHASSGRVARFQEQIRGLNGESKSKPNATARVNAEPRPSGAETKENESGTARSNSAGSSEGLGKGAEASETGSEAVKDFVRQHVPKASGRLLEELPAMTPEEKTELETEAGRKMTDAEAYLYRVNRLISDLSEVKPDDTLMEQREAFRKGLEKKPMAQQKIEEAGLKYKGELTKGSGVYMFEHPEYPGKTMALKEADITPEKLHEHVAEKLGLFETVK